MILNVLLCKWIELNDKIWLAELWQRQSVRAPTIPMDIGPQQKSTSAVLYEEINPCLLNVGGA